MANGKDKTYYEIEIKRVENALSKTMSEKLKRDYGMETIINALEKQIPKKPTHEATLYRCLTCPTCKNVIDEFTDFLGKKVRVTVQHCRFCGQKLDWEDENE